MAVPPDQDDFDFSGEEVVKAKLDDSELSDESPKSLQKVELDLDDAPFLEEEEEEEEIEEPEIEEQDLELEEDEPPFWKRKKILIILGSLILMLLLAAGGYFFVFSNDTPAPAPASAPTPEPTPTTTETVTPTESADATGTPTPPPPPPEYLIEMDPFLIEQHDPQGSYRVLGLKFSTKTIDKGLLEEMKQKEVVLRDAVYYYLKNKDIVFLTNSKYSDTLKQDILTVMNQYLATGQLDSVLIEEYVVR